MKSPTTLGNKTTDDQENDEFGKKFAEITKRRAERMDAAEVATVGLGDDIETVPKAKNPKTKKIALESKRTTTKLTTKTEIGGLDRAISLIPENLKVDGKKVIMTDGKQISAQDLELDRTATETMNFNLRDIREKVERQAILRALSHVNGNVAPAAELLGVSRPTLYDLIKKLNITV